MTEQSNRMDALVNQLLTLTKIENNYGNNCGDELIDVSSLLTTVEQEAVSLSGGEHTIFILI